MSKGMDSKKTAKKAPTKTPKEKKAEKQIKKADKGSSGQGSVFQEAKINKHGG
jgi:hypothetical protein